MLLKPADVAVRLSVSKQHVYRLLATGKLPAVRLGRRCVRVSEEALAEYTRQASSVVESKHHMTKSDYIPCKGARRKLTATGSTSNPTARTTTLESMVNALVQAV